MKAAGHFYGAELQKCLTESITKSRLENQIFSFQAEATAQPFAEAEAEWMEKDPETWEEIKKNATAFTCPVTKKPMINAKLTLHRGSLAYISGPILIMQLVRSVHVCLVEVRERLTEWLDLPRPE